MGFFDVLGAIFSPVKEVIKTVVMDVVVEGVKYVCEKIGDFFSGSSKTIGNTDSYDPDTATAGQTKALNEDLVEIKNQAIEYGEKLEYDFLQSGEEIIEKLTEQIKQVDSIDTSSFKEQCNDILREFEGAVAENITSKISLSDEDFLEIVALQAGEKKRQKFDAFSKRVAKKAFSEAADSFAENLSSSVKSVTNLLNVTLQSKRTIIKNAKSTLDKIKKAKNQAQKQEEQVNLSLDLCKKEALLSKMGS